MKKAYITTGTIDFFQRLYKKLINKHKKETIIIMVGKGHALLYHETNGKTVFQLPRRYDLIEANGPIPGKGFSLFHYIPVLDESRPVFEHNLAKRPRLIETAQGYLATRILRPIKSTHYLIITMWENKKDFEKWQEQETMLGKIGHEESIEINKIRHYAGESYIKSYYIGLKEDEENN